MCGSDEGSGGFIMLLYSLNGLLLQQRTLTSAVTAVAVSVDGDFFISAGEQCEVIFWTALE